MKKKAIILTLLLLSISTIIPSLSQAKTTKEYSETGIQECQAVCERECLNPKPRTICKKGNEAGCTYLCLAIVNKYQIPINEIR